MSYIRECEMCSNEIKVKLRIEMKYQTNHWNTTLKGGGILINIVSWKT